MVGVASGRKLFGPTRYITHTRCAALRSPVGTPTGKSWYSLSCTYLWEPHVAAPLLRFFVSVLIFYGRCWVEVLRNGAMDQERVKHWAKIAESLRFRKMFLWISEFPKRVSEGNLMEIAREISRTVTSEGVKPTSREEKIRAKVNMYNFFFHASSRCFFWDSESFIKNSVRSCLWEFSQEFILRFPNRFQQGFLQKVFSGFI